MTASSRAGARPGRRAGARRATASPGKAHGPLPVSPTVADIATDSSVGSTDQSGTNAKRGRAQRAGSGSPARHLDSNKTAASPASTGAARKQGTRASPSRRPEVASEEPSPASSQGAASDGLSSAATESLQAAPLAGSVDAAAGESLHGTSRDGAAAPAALPGPRREAEPEWQSVPTRALPAPLAAAAEATASSKHEPCATAATDGGLSAAPQTPVRVQAPPYCCRYGLPCTEQSRGAARSSGDGTHPVSQAEPRQWQWRAREEAKTDEPTTPHAAHPRAPQRGRSAAASFASSRASSPDPPEGVQASADTQRYR